MNQPDDLTPKYSAFTDEKLIGILVNNDDYTPAAIEAATAVLEQRGVPPEKYQSVQEEIEQKQKADESRANEPLEKELKILYLFLPFAGWLAFALVQLSYHEKGLHQKKAEHARYSIMGTGLWIGLGVLIWLVS